MSDRGLLVSDMSVSSLKALAFILGQAGLTATVVRKLMDEGAGSQRLQTMVAVAKGDIPSPASFARSPVATLLSQTEDDFVFLIAGDHDYTTIVPGDYDHGRVIKAFSEELNGKCSHWNESLSDENFNEVTDHLSPSRAIRVRFAIATRKTDTTKALTFLEGKKAILAGAQGLVFTASNFSQRLPRGTSIISLDRESALFVDDGGCKRFPRMYVGDGKISFYLDYWHLPIATGTLILCLTHEK